MKPKKMIFPIVLMSILFFSIDIKAQINDTGSRYEAISNTARLDYSCSQKAYLNRLEMLGNTSARKRSQTAKALQRSFRSCRNAGELKRISTDKMESLCHGNQVLWDWPDFWRFEGLTLALAEENYTDSIPTLVDCVNTTSFFTSLSRSRFPAQMALLKFGKEALPELRKSAIRPGDPKCSIISLLFAIGGTTEKDLLISRLKVDNDSNAEECVTRYVRN